MTHAMTEQTAYEQFAAAITDLDAEIAAARKHPSAGPVPFDGIEAAAKRLALAEYPRRYMTGAPDPAAQDEQAAAAESAPAEPSTAKRTAVASSTAGSSTS